MVKLELTKKGKLILLIISIIIILSITFILIRNNNQKIDGIYLDVELLTEGDKIDYEQNSLILHIDSKAKLSYNTVPYNKEIEIIFNNYDKEIINIDSNGIITALKTGKTELQIFDKNNNSSNIINIYVY